MRVEASGLHKRFGRLEVLRGLDFEIPGGSRVALVGPNGSGKSTLVRVLMGLLHYEGEVRIDGHAPSRERVAIARRMAYVPQVAPQLAAPVGELLAALERLRGLPKHGVEQAAAELGLDVPALRTRPFRSLSGGMKQKLLVALALASRASLLILDEPTGSLDPRSRERVLAQLGALGPEVTVLLCSHRLEEVRQLVDGVLVLEEGRLAYEGAVESFLAATTTSLIEVRAEGAGAARWLEQRGFRRTAGDRFVRSVDQDAKVKLVAEIGTELPPALRDLVVRDLEVADLGPGRSS